MKSTERIFNLLLGTSILSWAVLGAYHSDLLGSMSPVLLSITVLHTCVAILVFNRAPLRVAASSRNLLVCMPALFISAWAVSLANQGEHWPWLAELIFTIGTGLTVCTFLTLGKSFSILPALRQVVTSGPFQLVRHPAYLGELVMLLGCALASSSPFASLPFMIAVPFVALRILEEEKVLSNDRRYLQYQQTVPWRLIPRLW